MSAESEERKPATVSQLTFDVGGKAPDYATIKVTGGMLATQELRKGDEIHNPDGTITEEKVGS